MIAELSAGVAERDRLINQLTRDLANAEARHTTVQGVAAGYFCQLQDPTMDVCNGDSHALRVMRRTFSSQQQVLRQHRAYLRRRNIQCLLVSNLGVAAAVGVDVPGLNPRDMDINSRFRKLLTTQFPDFISFDGSTTFQNMVLRLEPSSAAPITPAMARATLTDPPRPIASLASFESSASWFGRRTLAFASSSADLKSSTSTSSTAVTVGVSASSSTDVSVGEPSSSAAKSLNLRRRSLSFDFAADPGALPDPHSSYRSA